MIDALKALLLGVVEGLTEFIPVSSTGHLLLLGHFLGFKSTGKAFEVLIQLGAILAILSVYVAKFWDLAKRLPSDPAARQFVIGIALGFLPAAVAGVVLHDWIKTVLYETPVLVCITLILGGFVLLWADKQTWATRHEDAFALTPLMCLKIGVFQALALIPGVSRSGATIVGGLMMGVSKRAAAEFSFFLALPTMAGAFAYDVYKNHDAFNSHDAALIGIGFVAAFVTAVLVVRGVLNFITRHGFAPFAWWRIAVGIAGLVGLNLFR
jgi:undecaprenyl-diphosphatase